MFFDVVIGKKKRACPAKLGGKLAYGATQNVSGW